MTQYTVRTKADPMAARLDGVTCINQEARESERIYVRSFSHAKITEVVSLDLISPRGADEFVVGVTGFTEISAAQLGQTMTTPHGYVAACTGIIVPVVEDLSKTFQQKVVIAHGGAPSGADEAARKAVEAVRRQGVYAVREVIVTCPEYLIYLEDRDVEVMLLPDKDSFSAGLAQYLDVLLFLGGRDRSHKIALETALTFNKRVIVADVISAIARFGKAHARDVNGEIIDAAANLLDLVYTVSAGDLGQTSGDLFSDMTVEAAAVLRSVFRRILPPEVACAWEARLACEERPASPLQVRELPPIVAVPADGAWFRTPEGAILRYRLEGSEDLLKCPGVELANPDAPKGEQIVQRTFRHKRLLTPDEGASILGAYELGYGVTGYSSLTSEQATTWGVRGYEVAVETAITHLVSDIQEAYPVRVRIHHGASAMGVDLGVQEAAKKLSQPQIGHTCPRYLFYVLDDDGEVIVYPDSKAYSRGFVRGLSVLISAGGRKQALSQDVATALQIGVPVVLIDIPNAIAVNGGPPTFIEGKVNDATAALCMNLRLARTSVESTGDAYAELRRQVIKFTRGAARHIVPVNHAYRLTR